MDSELFKSLKDYADTILELKKAGGREQAVQAACCAGSLLLLRCREESRQAALEAEHGGEAAALQQKQLDHDSLQLHNLVYEQQYYDREISSCRAFQTNVPDEKLNCIGLEDFQRISEPASALTSHDRELARLNYELQQRKQLKGQLQSLQQSKQQAVTDLNAATARIDDLRTFMESISRSSKPLMETSLPDITSVKDNKEAAELLPLPLYIIYCQAAASSNVVGLPLRVDVDGSTAAAARFAAELATTSSTQGAPAAAAAAAVAPDPHGRRRRKSDVQELSVYKVHPLSVIVDVLQQNQPHNQQLMQLTFKYYTQLKLVGVHAGSQEDDEVLTDLFLGDLGNGDMIENVAIAACNGSPLEFGGAERPRPFRWAQELAGVDVIPSLPASWTGLDKDQLLAGLSAYRSQLRLETLLERLAVAKQGQLALKEILAKLSKKEQPPAGSWESKLPSKISTLIYSWKHLSDTGMHKNLEQQGLSAAAVASTAAAATTAAIGQVLQVWAGGRQQSSLQEEGEVAGAVDGDASSRLMHVDTTEEDLLQGLLAEEPPAAAAGGPSSAAAFSASRLAAANGVLVHAADADVLAFEENMAEERYEPGMMGLDHVDAGDDAGEASATSDTASDGQQMAEVVSGLSSAHSLQARYSTYRLVLRASSLEVHSHVHVFTNYPLCPPVFRVTKMLDTSRSKPVPLTAVNEVLMVEQQVNTHAVRAAQGLELLPVQVMMLRCCIDSLSNQLRADTAKDLVDRLRARQQLRGKDRQSHMMLGCP